MRTLNRSLRCLALVLCLGATVATVAACNKETTTTEQGPPKAANIDVASNEFAPATVTIAKGGTITWKNNDVIEYSLKSPGLFEEVLMPGASWSYTFQETGEYRVYDDITSQPSEMKVVVK